MEDNAIFLYYTPEGKTYTGHLKRSEDENNFLADVVECITFMTQTGMNISGIVMGDMITPVDPRKTLVKLDFSSPYHKEYIRATTGITSPNGKILKPC